jgi:hypothetical protein
MADSKISALPASTTPLAGTEVLPIVQSSATKQVSVANLTAGREISATQLTLTTGNLIVASGQGIDFSATPGTGTSELLADYEEGTWTPTLTCGTSGTITISSPANSMRYTKVGRQVTITGFISVSSVSLPLGDLSLNGLPFNPASDSACYLYGFGILNLSAHTAVQGAVTTGAPSVIIRGYNSGTSVVTFANNIQGGSGLFIFSTYFV